MLIDSADRQDGNFLMLIDSDSEVRSSCSVTWQNEFYVFGGNSKKRQISKLDGCELKSVGTLGFDHSGSCSNMNDDTLYLCFNIDATEDYMKCRSATDPLGSFTEIPSTNYDHRYARTVASESKLSFSSLTEVEAHFNVAKPQIIFRFIACCRQLQSVQCQNRNLSQSSRSMVWTGRLSIWLGLNIPHTYVHVMLLKISI